MAFWGGAKILIEVEKQGIVQPFCNVVIDCSAYTLTLGEEAFVTPSFGDDPRNNQKRSLCEPSTEVVGGKKKKKGGGSVIIPPGQFAFLLTQEIVCIPKNVMGFISLKSGAKFRGLIKVSGFPADLFSRYSTRAQRHCTYFVATTCFCYGWQICQAECRTHTTRRSPAMLTFRAIS
jgi:dCTP deaminase